MVCTHLLYIPITYLQYNKTFENHDYVNSFPKFLQIPSGIYDSVILGLELFKNEKSVQI